MLIDHTHYRHYSPSPGCLGNLPSLTQILWAHQADTNLISLLTLQRNVHDRHLQRNTHLYRIDQSGIERLKGFFLIERLNIYYFTKDIKTDTTMSLLNMWLRSTSSQVDCLVIVSLKTLQAEILLNNAQLSNITKIINY